MLLIRPTPGACVDRQTILRLKMDEATRTGVDARHFADEHHALQLYLEENWFGNGQPNWIEQFHACTSELARVNQALWHLEDEIRHLKSLTPAERQTRTERVVTIALAIPELNDERAQMVSNIDALFGVRAQEKLYRDPSRTNEK
jgi:hypothetical protein